MGIDKVTGMWVDSPRRNRQACEARLAAVEVERDAALKRATEARETAENYAGHCNKACKQLEAVEAERDAAQAGEARAVEEARKARAWEARTARLYKRAIKALRYMQQYQEEKGAGTALSILVAMEDIDDVLQLADNELGRHVDESLAWIAQQRREAAAEVVNALADGCERVKRSILAQELRGHAAALRAGEVPID